MRKTLMILSCLMLLAGCHESLEDRAAREVKEFTEKNCPTPVMDNTRTDSLTFDKASHILTYYNTLCGLADDAEKIKGQEKKLRSLLLESVRSSTQLKAYKEAGFLIRYVYHSEKNPQLVLFETKFTSKDY